MKPRPSTSALRVASSKTSVPSCHLHLRRNKHSSRHARVRDDLRNLLRDTAQPVAVVTSLMPVWDPLHASYPSTQVHAPTHDSEGPASHKHSQDPKHAKFHGATLSSFSSIAMDPHPLIAFSLRIPSRMAMTFKHVHPPPHQDASLHPTSSTSSIPRSQSTTSHFHSKPIQNPLKDLPTHLVINILSSSQSHIATLFSRADLYPHPFASTPYHLTKEGLPVLKGSLGALSCRLVAASWPLHDLDSLQLRSGSRSRRGEREGEGEGEREGGGGVVWEGEGVASELFIGQVVRVEDVNGPGGYEEQGQCEKERQTRTPLLYYQRRYTTTTPQDIPHSKSSRGS
ncbi:flavin reductase like domain-containing protein [Irpex rosettiformis]|uniref:Flavin reductase like domain-containing protein n=1 Tax=Irpex rosettiformis TaxID=378272 RepID=A0ACB8UBF1_9APHY|nr:flavin reductase like domain-containing protein [Irpex rosettiformis]